MELDLTFEHVHLGCSIVKVETKLCAKVNDGALGCGDFEALGLGWYMSAELARGAVGFARGDQLYGCRAFEENARTFVELDLSEA